MTTNQLDRHKFYRYFLTQNAPLHIVDGASQWPALKKWSQEYLLQKLGNLKLNSRTIKTHKRDKIMANSPFGEFLFDYNDGQKTHDEKMTFKYFLEKRTVYK